MDYNTNMQTIISNLIICCMHPNKIWSNHNFHIENQVAKQGIDNPPEVLFSYPESSEKQKLLLKAR